MTQPLPHDSIKRTAHGILPSFDAIFKDVYRAPAVKRCPHTGRNYDHKPGDLFLSLDWNVGTRSIDPKGKWALYCTPVIKLPEFSPAIAPRNSWDPWVTRPTAAIKVIRWEKYDHYLVLAVDPNYMSDVWLAFVPGSAALNVPT